MASRIFKLVMILEYFFPKSTLSIDRISNVLGEWDRRGNGLLSEIFEKRFKGKIFKWRIWFPWSLYI